MRKNKLKIDPEIKALIREMNKAGIVTTACCQGHSNSDGYSSAYVSIDLSAMLEGEICIKNNIISIYWDRE